NPPPDRRSVGRAFDMIDANVAALRADVAGAAAVLDVHATAHGPRVDVPGGGIDFNSAGHVGDLERTKRADEFHVAGDRADRDIGSDRTPDLEASGLCLDLEDGAVLAFAFAVLVGAQVAEDAAVVAMPAPSLVQFAH